MVSVENKPTESGSQENVATESDNVKVDNKIKHQMEYYFGDFNFPKDKFLQEKSKEEDGWIKMETMLNFKRLASISTDVEAILTAIKESKVVEVNVEDKKVRRNPQLPVIEWNEERKKDVMNRTVYCKGFDKTSTYDDILPFFQTFDDIENVQLRTYTSKDNTKGFKGSVFATFKTREEAEKFLAKEKVSFKDVDLICKWQQTYFEDKKKEIDDRKKEKMEKKKEMKKAIQDAKKGGDDEDGEEESLPKGSVLYISGLGNETSREDIKEKLEKDFQINPKEDIAFIYYNRGETEAKLRFKKENAATELKTKIGETEVEIKDSKVTIKVLEGDEETSFLNQCLEDIKNLKSRSGHKRKGGFRGGRGGKRGRRN